MPAKAPKTKTSRYKVTYFSVRKQKNMKKDFATMAQLNEFVKAKSLTTYGIWKLTKSVSA